jgi:hypothetical protein
MRDAACQRKAVEALRAAALKSAQKSHQAAALKAAAHEAAIKKCAKKRILIRSIPWKIRNFLTNSGESLISGAQKRSIMLYIATYFGTDII